MDWGVVLLASSTGLFVPEAAKWLRRVRGTNQVPEA